MLTIILGPKIAGLILSLSGTIIFFLAIYCCFSAKKKNLKFNNKFFPFALFLIFIGFVIMQ